MTTWTLAQVWRVRDSGLQCHLDAPMAKTPKDLGHVAMAAADEFTAYVRELLATDAVDDEPHQEDLVVVSEPDEPQYGPGALALAIRWRPAVTEGELVGGRLDGTVLPIPDPMALRLPLEVVTPELTGHVGPPDDPSVVAMPVPIKTTRTYVLSGWDNAARRWRLTLAASS